MKMIFISFVLNGNTLTDDYASTQYSWTRDSGDAAADATWNSSHAAVGNVITLTADDVSTAAVFTCTLNSIS